MLKYTRACPVARQMMAKGLIESSGRGVVKGTVWHVRDVLAKCKKWHRT